MGWFTTYGASRQDIIRELTETRSLGEKPGVGGGTVETIEKFSNGFTQLYAVHESTSPTGEKKRWIGVYLLQKSKEGWGYKPMHEGMHPYFFACPLKYLAMVPEECKAWRESVRAYWKQRAERRKLR
jgi:hypothetical protein